MRRQKTQVEIWDPSTGRTGVARPNQGTRRSPLGSVREAQEKRAVHDLPGTLLERRVDYWLERHGYVRYRSYIPQYSLVGGMTRADSYLPLRLPRPLALYAQGHIWHSTPEALVQDEAIKLALMAAGVDSLWIEEWVILSDRWLDEYMKLNVGNF